MKDTSARSPKTPAELVCIACPIACRLTVTQAPDGQVSVAGNRCPKGELYGKEEMLAPRRIVTAVVPTSSMDFPCVPVRTDTPVARDLVMELLADLYRRKVDLPVKSGQVLVADFHGARVIITRTLPPDQVSPVG